MHPKLLKRWEKEEGALERLLKSTKAKVVRWEYWTDLYWHWDPSNDDVTTSAKRTTKQKAYRWYGYDAVGRVIVIMSGLADDKEPTPYHKEFLSYSRNTIRSTSYCWDHLDDVAEATLMNGRTTRVESADGWHTVQWRGDKVARIQFGEHRKKPVLEWCFDESGKRIGMYKLPRKVKLPKGVTTASLAKNIHERLMRVVPKRVAWAGIKQPSYCMALAYDGEGNGVLPPSLAIGLDSERQNWIRTKGAAAKDFIWNPEEFRQHKGRMFARSDRGKFLSAYRYRQLGGQKPALERGSGRENRL